MTDGSSAAAFAGFSSLFLGEDSLVVPLWICFGDGVVITPPSAGLVALWFSFGLPYVAAAWHLCHAALETLGSCIAPQVGSGLDSCKPFCILVRWTKPFEAGACSVVWCSVVWSLLCLRLELCSCFCILISGENVQWSLDVQCPILVQPNVDGISANLMLDYIFCFYGGSWL
ncbi:hypothetical protein Nepgr_026615 [Nepenthes gracilis]|uniref:Uncharacterized protein n=1 Tax=Nepenthes gracilis TaxID=150966 RepID=A0AAD3T8J7_NEPGR|nr:hypothetical protein Nepgr_026615 [Nepenthes gracilis]